MRNTITTHTTRALAYLAGGALALLWLKALGDVHMHALRAAGSFADAHGEIAGIQTFTDAIRGNVIWAVGVLAALGVVVIGAMFATGHSRAQDYAHKALWGFLIIAGSGGIVA